VRRLKIRPSACLLFGPEFFGRRLFATFMFRFRFASGFFATRFFRPVFFPIMVVSMRSFSRVFGTPFPWLLLARRLDPAQSAPEILDLPFIADFLFFRQFNQFQDVLHLFQSLFERFHDPPHIIHCPGERRGRMLLRLRFLARPFGGRSISGFRLRVRPFNWRGCGAGIFMQMFFWRRRGLSGGGRRSGVRWRGGMGRT
jgi:hypothetical protein